MAPTSRPYYESKFALNELPTEMPTDGMAARHVQATIVDQHELDFPEKLNTSSYVTVVEEPEEENVALVGLKVNLADQTVYPSSFDLHDRCVSMIAKLWHAPDGFAGAGTVGSTEACLLAGLALKFRWRHQHAQKLGKQPHDPAVRGAYPNLVISTMFQAAWEKLFKYMCRFRVHFEGRVDGVESVPSAQGHRAALRHSVRRGPRIRGKGLAHGARGRRRED
jgi:glutamate decarboxylase